MKALKPFNIAFVGLSGGEHEFGFELDDDFFACFEGAEIVNARLKGTLVLNKKTNMMDLDFYVTGEVEQECDRCLESFWQTMDIHKTLYVKFGDHHEEQDDDIIIIPATESHIDVAQYFYEFITLGLPVRRVHKDDETGKPTCDPEIINQLEKYMPQKGGNAENKDEKPTDARWDALKNIKFN